MFIGKSPKESKFNHFYKFFYETKSDKIEYLKSINITFGINFYYKDNKQIDLNNFDIKNEDYLIEIGEKKYTINFNNFVIQSLFRDMVSVISKRYEICLSNIKNFSLQGSIINNRCINDINIFKLFQDDINETIKSSTLKEAFNCIIPFQNYNYPFEKKKFLEQVNEVIFYIPFLKNNILGVTLRNLGLIIINRNIFNLSDCNNINRESSELLIKICFGKITALIHKIIFYYLISINHYKYHKTYNNYERNNWHQRKILKKKLTSYILHFFNFSF